MGRLSALPGFRTIAGKESSGRSTSFLKSASLAIGVALAVSLPVLAQHVRVYQDGNTWVEETTGTLPVAPDLRITTDVGAIDVHGKSGGVTYVIRKRAAVSTREEAEREFQKLKLSAVKLGNQVVVEGHLLQRDVTRFTADFSM